MKMTIALATIGLCLACATGAPPGPDDAKPRPNVILILVDTLRRDHLGVYGYDRATSPNIDRLAADAVRFDRGFSQAPWTTPSVASMLTSLYPSRLQIGDVPNTLQDDADTLPEILQRHGYTTCGVISHEFLGARWNFDQGFDLFHEDLAQGHDFVSSPGVTDQVLAFLDTAPAEPFFLFAHYFDPHALYLQHDGFAFADPDYRGRFHAKIKPQLLLRKVATDEIEARDVDYLRALYDSDVAFTDHHIGRLLNELRRRDLYDDALIVLTADHGEEFFDHGDFGHTKTLFDELIKVPLLIKYPGRSAGAVSDREVGLIDLLPTVLDYLDIEAPTGIEGLSLLEPPAADRPRVLFSETSRRNVLRAAIQSSRKLIHDLERDELRLYDLAADPAERRDLAGSGSGGEERLRQALRDWQARHSRDGQAPESIELDSEELDRLRDLGYVD